MITERKRIILHGISVAEFAGPKLQNVVLYDHSVLGPVNRQNWISILVTSFAVSRGHADRQMLYYEWLGINTGFDYVSTLENFTGAKGWNCLGLVEQAYFIKQFQAVPGHHRSKAGPKTVEYFYLKPNFSLEAQIEGMFEYVYGETALARWFMNQYYFPGMKFPDFVRSLNSLDMK